MKMLRNLKNTVWNGIAIGLAVPLITGSLVWWLMQHVVALRQADLLLIGCIALNAILMNYYFRLNKDHIARGLISVTFLWAFAFFAYKVF